MSRRYRFSPDGQTIAYKSSWGSSVSVHFLDINTQTKTYGPNLGGSEHTWDVLWVVAAEVKKRGRGRGNVWFSTLFEDHTEPVSSVSFSPDGKTIVSGSSHGVSTAGGSFLWDVATQTKIGTLDTSYVNSVLFSPDGKTIASVSISGGSTAVRIFLWDVATQTKNRHP